MITKRKENLWQFRFDSFGSCVYLLKQDKKNIIIDTSSLANKEQIISYLKELNLSPGQIDVVILTHNHYDHADNISLFANAKIYGSKKDFGENLLDPKKLKIKGLKIIETPGHSEGSICIYIPKEKILFSGDTLFFDGISGRTDLPTSSKEKMEKSLKKLSKIKFKILCPGHISREQLNNLNSRTKP